MGQPKKVDFEMPISLEMARRIKSRRSRHKPLTADEQQQIVLGWLEGKTRRQLSEQFGRGPGTIAKVLQLAEQEAERVLAARDGALPERDAERLLSK